MLRERKENCVEERNLYTCKDGPVRAKDGECRWPVSSGDRRLQP